MELRQLGYFAAVATDGTYTAAAQRLHVAQPALWKQVHDLERELGVALFERVGRRVRITTAGTALLERAEQLLSGAARLEVLAEDLRLGRSGRVRVRCFAPHITCFLASVVASFRAEHPGITVELSEHGQPAGPRVLPSLVESLRSGATDVITTSRLGEGHDDLDGFPAYEVRIVAVSSAIGGTSGRSSRRRALAVEDLTDVPLVVSPRGFLSRERLEAACRDAGITPRIEAESSSPAALVALAEHGVGTAIVADDAISTSSPLLPLALGGSALADEVWVYRIAARTDPALDTFFEAARTAAPNVT